MEIESFLKFISHICKRPAMFAVSGVEDLNLVIFGYQCGLGQTPMAREVSDFMFEFRKLVNKRYGSRKDYHWAKLIRFHSGSDSHTIEIFAKLFNALIEKKGYKIELS